jgi:hypothetical protein
MRRLSVLLIPALLLAACGGGIPSASPTAVSPTVVATTVAPTNAVPSATPVETGLPLYTGPIDLASNGTDVPIIAAGPLPVTFATELTPPAATAAVYTTQAGYGSAVFADTTSPSDLIRYYTKIIIAHGGTLGDVSYDTTYGLDLAAYASDLTLFVHAVNGLVSIPMNSPLSPDYVFPQVVYPADMPKSMLPDDTIAMDKGGTIASIYDGVGVDIWTFDSAKSLIAKANATYKALKATNIKKDTGDSPSTGILMRGTVKGKTLEIWIDYKDLLNQVEVTTYVPEF